jgi:hypothetical protein
MSDDSDFARLLADFNDDEIWESEDTIYGLWPNLTLAFFNRGWTRFASENGGESKINANHSLLGRSVLESFASSLRPFFKSNYEKCLRERCPWEHSFECSSAKLFRTFRMLTLPLGHSEGLLVINSLRRETFHTQLQCPPLDELYRNHDGIITQCCHCRRIRRCGTENTWDWIPDWLTNPPANLSHGLCEPCVGFHYSPDSQQAGFAKTFQTSL